MRKWKIKNDCRVLRENQQETWPQQNDLENFQFTTAAENRKLVDNYDDKVGSEKLFT